MVGGSMRFLRMYLDSLLSFAPLVIVFALLIMLAECDPDIGHRY